MHGDHHYGLFEILLQRKRLALSTQLPKLQLLIPNSKLAESISFCSDHVTNVSDEIHFVDNIDLVNRESFFIYFIAFLDQLQFGIDKTIIIHL